MSDKKKKYLREIKEIVEKNQIELLSNEYISYTNPLRFRCKICNKEWKNSSKNIKDRIRVGKPGMLCPFCHLDERGAPRLKITKSEYLNRYKKIAKERGGELLSKKYINAKTKLKWKCNICGNIWWATPDNIKKGNWCPQCALERLKELRYDINDMKILAKEKLYGGKCLSEKYLGISEPIYTKKGRSF